MYKKLANLFNLFNFSLIVFFVTSFCTTIFLAIRISDFNFVFDMINNLDKDFFIFSIEEESNVINTEILARRIGSGLATAGLGGVGTGIGLVFSGLIKGFSRNPSLKDDLFSYAIFGFALTEAIGLFALMMAFMLLYA